MIVQFVIEILVPLHLYLLTIVIIVSLAFQK